MPRIVANALSTCTNHCEERGKYAFKRPKIHDLMLGITRYNLVRSRNKNVFPISHRQGEEVNRAVRGWIHDTEENYGRRLNSTFARDEQGSVDLDLDT
ncbi:hypothetical protein FGIG_07089 [Fasciola gigantica]|uniref:Uncharacterized protein n=1 Tax=Fasciola gigantica TaxID=46835 RepID=A0A504Y9J0_FASGI|nr:hypothetical protein FGIG_07089 [Fasciola gigantica]